MKTDCTISRRGRRCGVGSRLLATCPALLTLVLTVGAPPRVFAQAESRETQPEQRPRAEAPAAAQGRSQGSQAREGEQRQRSAKPAQPRLPEWRVEVMAGNKAELEIEDASGKDLRVAIANAPTGLPWHVRLAKGPFSIDAQELYLLEFRGRSDGVRKIGASVIQLRAPFKNLSPNLELEVTPMWRTYRTHFKVPRAEDRARLQFFVGGSRHSVELADVSLTRAADGTDVLTTPFVPKPVEPPKEPAESAAGESGSGLR